MLDDGPNSSKHENIEKENSKGPNHDKKKEEPAIIESNILKKKILEILYSSTAKQEIRSVSHVRRMS